MWCSKNDNLYFVKAKCFASQKKNDKPHEVWTCISLDPPHDAVHGYCTCVAGSSGYCNHVMALLYQISHFSKSTANKIPDDISKTSIPQIWNKPRVQGITPELVMSCGVVKVKSEVAQDSGRVRSDHISSSLYEARREASLCNNNTLLSACQKSLAEENPLYGITYMATPDNEATCYVKTKMANHVPVG